MDLAFVGTAIVTFLAVVVTLIVLHELAHYGAARMFGIKPKAFSIGFGPEVAGFTDKHGTRWKLAPIPLGGFVKFHGEMHPNTGTAEEASHPESFARLARWKRAVIIFAGPFANLVICALVFLGLFLLNGVPVISNQVADVAPQSGAAEAGLQPGDEIISWNGADYDGHAFIRYAKIHPGGEMKLQVRRDGQVIPSTVQIQPQIMEDRWGNRSTIGRIGVTFAPSTVTVTNPFQLGGRAVTESIGLMKLQAVTIGQMIKGERPLDELSGPVRLAKFSAEQYLTGWTAFFYFTAVLSCAVAFMNLLPIPGLDGGYLALYAIEGAMRHDLSRQMFGGLQKGGLAAVALIFVFGLSNDLRVLFFS